MTTKAMKTNLFCLDKEKKQQQEQDTKYKP